MFQLATLSTISVTWPYFIGKVRRIFFVNFKSDVYHFPISSLGSTFELLVHHLTVTVCFGIAVSTRTYVAYAALSLVVEINSVFLHARQLLTIGGVKKSSWIYR